MALFGPLSRPLLAAKLAASRFGDAGQPVTPCHLLIFLLRRFWVFASQGSASQCHAQRGPQFGNEPPPLYYRETGGGCSVKQLTNPRPISDVAVLCLVSTNGADGMLPILIAVHLEIRSSRCQPFRLKKSDLHSTFQFWLIERQQERQHLLDRTITK